MLPTLKASRMMKAEAYLADYVKIPTSQVDWYTANLAVVNMKLSWRCSWDKAAAHVGRKVNEGSFRK